MLNTSVYTFRSGYPGPDPDVGAFLRARANESVDQLRIRYLIFLDNLFRQVNHVVHRIVSKLETKDWPESPRALASLWRGYLSSSGAVRRNQLYKSVTTAADRACLTDNGSPDPLKAQTIDGKSSW